MSDDDTGSGDTDSALAGAAVTIAPTAIGVDPTTDRVWVADDVFKQVWSIPTSGSEPERLEIDFTLKEGSRPDLFAFARAGNRDKMGGVYLACPDMPAKNTHGKVVGVDKHIAQEPENP